MFPRSGNATPSTVVVNPTPSPSTSTSDALIQAWIRGSGMHRRVTCVIAEVAMEDAHWQSFIVMPGIWGHSVNSQLTVVKPTADLVSKTTPFTPTPSPPLEWNQGLNPPQGAWTLLFVPDTNVSATLKFEETAHFVQGHDGSTGQTINTTTPCTLSLPIRRMVFLMLIGANNYYVHIF